MIKTIGVLVMILLVGCGTITNKIATPTSVTFINRDDAIMLGLRIAYLGGFDIRTVRVNPESGYAELTTLAQAMKQLAGSETVTPGNQFDALVWIVAFEGQWQDAFPRTTEMPTPGILAHFRVIIDANTGGNYYVDATY